MKTVLKLSLVTGLVLSAGLLMALPGCGGDDTSLEGTKWVMTAYAVDGSMQDALSDTAVDAMFADGTVSGTGGCNQYNGSYELDGDKLTVGMLAGTMMACEPPILDQETAYMKALQSAASFKIDGDMLGIMDASGATVLEFQAAEG